MKLDFARYLNIRSATMPVLDSAGARVAFLSDITGTAQVWNVAVTPEAGSWPEQLTFFTDKVWELYGTPAANHLIAVSDVGGNEYQQLYHIVSTEQGSHNITRLTADSSAIHRFGAFSADGQQIVYTCNARNPLDFDPYWMDLMTGEARRLGETPGNRMIGAWAPDGTQLLLLDVVATEQIELSVVEVATGAERPLTVGQPWARYAAPAWTAAGIYLLTDRTHDQGAVCRLDPTTGELAPLLTAAELLRDQAGASGELDLLAVSAAAALAACTLNLEGYSQLYLLELSSGRYQAVEGVPAGVITNLAFGSDGRQLVFDLQSPTSNSDIWLLDVATGAVRQVTFSNRAGIDAASFVAPELLHFESHDGLQIPAFYYRPHSRPPADGYPCILYVHGGPASQQRPDFDVRFQYFLQQGLALLVTNVRGSTGYGRTYMMLDDVEKRMDSVADLKHAVLWLHGREEVDPARIAIYGRSYGGFMTLAALTHYPELFAAGIDVVGIANWVTFLERTSAWRRSHREREYGSLDNHPDLLEQLSPIHRIERIDMPLLVVAGDNDPRVPLYESEQVVERVRSAGGTVEFLHYGDEGHKISKLHNRIDSFTRMANFLERYL